MKFRNSLLWSWTLLLLVFLSSSIQLASSIFCYVCTDHPHIGNSDCRNAVHKMNATECQYEAENGCMTGIGRNNVIRRACVVVSISRFSNDKEMKKKSSEEVCEYGSYNGYKQFCTCIKNNCNHKAALSSKTLPFFGTILFTAGFAIAF